MSDSLLNQALLSLSDRLDKKVSESNELPSEWIQKHFYVPDPRDPVTGELKRPGPIILADLQIRLIDEALSKDENGMFKYSTIIYSAIKKSGKSALSSAVALYMAYHNPSSYVPVVANDGKQADDRLYGPIQTCFRLHDQLGGIFKGIKYTQTGVVLPNYTKLEPINVDAAGEAGSQPLAIFFSELWGFTTPKKEKLFSELTLPPTLYGKSIEWVESYAGFVGESNILWNLYETGFLKGEPHPDFKDLVGVDGPVVRINPAARMFVYWDTEPRMVWQQEEGYYQHQATRLHPSEFQRLHRNQWATSLDAFIQEEWWQACENEGLPLLENSSVPVVVGIDMAETRDCAALVAVSRDPFNPEIGVAVRGVKIFNPKHLGGIIDQEEVVRPIIEQWAKQWNVVCWVYDPREMSKLAQDLNRDGIGWFRKFGQTNPRAVADKALHDMVVAKQLCWNHNTTVGDIGYPGGPDDTLYKHITLAGASIKAGGFRIEKLTNNTKIDAAVALSMAANIAMELAIFNDEMSEASIISRYARGEISEEQFSKLIRWANPALQERLKHGRS